MLREDTRKPAKAPSGDQTVRRAVALTCTEPPGVATHWTGRAMARDTGVSLRSVQRIWAAHDLQAAINRYIAEHNADPMPFIWTKTPRQILAKLNLLNAPVW